VEVALKIKREVGVDDWQQATEDQLKLRNRIHEYMLVYSEVITDVDLVLDAAIKIARHREDYKKERLMKSYLPTFTAPTGETKIKGLKKKVVNG
jgi:hypothetical protein